MRQRGLHAVFPPTLGAILVTGYFGGITRPKLLQLLMLLLMVHGMPRNIAINTQISVVLSAAKDQFVCEDGCKSLKALHVA